MSNPFDEILAGETRKKPAANPFAIIVDEEQSVGDQARGMLANRTNPVEQAVGGVVEPLLKMGSGAIAKPVSDVMGLAALAKARLTGDMNADVSGFKNYIQQGLTYEPRTAAGQSPVNPLNAIPNAIGAVVGGVANKAADFVGGGAEADTVRGMAANATREAIPHALAIAGAKYTPKATKHAAEIARVKELARKQDAVAKLPHDVNVIEAKAAGFKLPPSEAGAGKTMQAAESLAGRGKFVENLESVNARKATQIIHDELGLPKHVPLTKGAVEEVIANAGKSYEKIRALGTPFVADKKYLGDITNLNAKVAAARRNATTWNPEFATIMNDMKKASRSADEAVDLMKSLRAESSANFAAVEKATGAKPNQLELAKFQKKAAQNLEDMVHRNLDRMGKKDLSAEFLEARKTIAKSKTIEKVLDENGIINSEKLGKLKERGAYMSGGMDTVAKFGRAFPDVAGKPKPSANTPLTSYESLVGVGSVGAAMAHPLGWAALSFPAGRLALRSFLESGMGQKMVGMPKAYSPSTMSEAMKAFSQLSPEAQQAMAYSLMQPGQQ